MSSDPSNTAAPTVPAATSTLSITIKDFKFLPQSVTVPVGSTVTGRNLDDEPHTVSGAGRRVAGASHRGAMIRVPRVRVCDGYPIDSRKPCRRMR